ncbi:hypothetical protein NDU88_004358 [Pleurodeles waltl]|uniref:Uncharacterized protein n=1 Tax=Pleurodeles waltl TaxID=8319 RepID=A0AAV7M645_PLEWA|nr:hypothetical protein NDU88_004358 [Pleurodeles waltl]
MVTSAWQERRGVRRHQREREERRGVRRRQRVQWRRRGVQRHQRVQWRRRTREAAVCGGRPVSDVDEILGAREESAPNEDSVPEGTSDYGGRRRSEAGHVLGRTWPFQVRRSPSV